MVRGGSHVALGLVAGFMGMDVYVILGTSGYHSELHRFLLLPAWVS